MRVRRVAALTTLALALAGCGDENPAGPKRPSADATAICEFTPVEDLSALPEDLPLAEYGEIRKVSRRRGYIGAVAVSESTIIELHPELARLLRRTGYKTVFAENEGFESEIVFQKGKRINGAFRLREGPCRGQVTINFLYGLAPS